MASFARILISTVVLAAACGGGTQSAGAASGATAVTATLTDKAIQLDQVSGAAGTVIFKVVNAGTVVHSLILLRTDVPHDKISPDPKDASRVDQGGLLRETGQIPVGQSKEFSVKLAAGTYVLVCNEPAHYAIGMHAPFTAK
jgi:uncharacterized cupredoxin-like copper-binding protein